jgi:hypothetical protein
MAEEILEVDEVAALLKCDPETVESRTRCGDLPGLKFGRSWIYPKPALMSRLCDLAIEECAKRKLPSESVAVVPTSRRRGRGRVPPTLPEFPGDH